mmetsp:Transcript_31270/g.74617  ORF Transcript_31270/g.74617 Transcript_31270/m.74617 type:complete len:225 (+) Transcript_31270:976-1650(+)
MIVSSMSAYQHHDTWLPIRRLRLDETVVDGVHGLPENILIGELVREKARAVLELHDQQNRIRLGKLRQQLHHHLHGEGQHLAGLLHGQLRCRGVFPQRLLEQVHAPRWRKVSQCLKVILRQRWIGLAEDSDGAPQHLAGQPQTVARTRAHGAKDRKHAEGRDRVHHHVLCHLNLARAGSTFNDHNTAIAEGTALGRLRSSRRLARDWDGLVTVNFLAETGAQQL